MKRRNMFLFLINTVSFVLSAVSLYFAIISIGPADEFFIFSALTAVLGILGLAGSLGKGNFASGCLITAIVVSSGFALFSLVYSIADGDIFVISLVYFCLYTAGAVFAYREKRKEKNGV